MSEFEVTIAAEVDEEEAVADVFYGAMGVADVRYDGSTWLIRIHVPADSGHIVLPFQSFLLALNEARDRLERLYAKPLPPDAGSHQSF
jgi:hypothetical protein